MMKRILTIGLLILVGAACRTEEDLMPAESQRNYFVVAEDATDAESILRRDFYARTGSYLLFNDTLRRELIGHRENGEAIYTVETVELSYSISSISKNKQSFKYLGSIDEKEKTARFIEENLFSVMTPEVYPYSVLLVDSVFNTVFYYEEGSEESGVYGDRFFERYYSGSRCLAISVGDIGEMAEADQTEMIKGIVGAMIINKFASRAEWGTSFYAWYEGLYSLIEGDLFGEYYEETEGWNYNPDVREFGFLSGEMEEDEDFNSYLTSPTKDQDLSDYVDVLLAGGEEDFLSENEEFPIVLKKYHILKEIVATMGFDLSKLN